MPALVRLLLLLCPLCLLGCGDDTTSDGTTRCPTGQVPLADGTCPGDRPSRGGGGETQVPTSGTGASHPGDSRSSVSEVSPTPSAAICTPGDFLRCADRERARICDDAGRRPGELVSCPAESPHCLESAQGCTDRFCDEGLTFCDNDHVYQCNGDGSDAERVASCARGCEGGRCIDPCTEVIDKDTHLGCEFYAVWLDQADVLSENRHAMAISVANAENVPTNVTIEDGNDIIVDSFTLEPGALRRVQVDLSSDRRRGSRIGSTTWRVRANGPVTVHQFNPPDNQNQFSNDASLLLPRHALGREHMILGWPTYRWGIGLFGDDNHAMFAVVAVESGTRVTIRPTAALASGDGVPAIAAGAEETFTLQAGEVLYYQSPGATNSSGIDLSGTRVDADRPVAVFSAHQCAFVPANVGWCDHLEQQMPSIDRWGRQHVGAMFHQRGSEYAAYRLLSSADGVTVETTPPVDGVHGTTLSEGQVVAFNSDADFLLDASAPVALARFMVGSDTGCRDNQFGEQVDCLIPRRPACIEDGGIGDPAFLLSVPVQQYLDEYVFLVPNQYQENYISVIYREGADVILNGVPLPDGSTPIAGTPWRVYRQAISPGVHRLDASLAAGLEVYGYDCAVSYAYPGGMGVSR